VATPPDFPKLPAGIFAAGGASRYGTLAQGGNAEEWLESPFDPSIASGLKTIRGGAWSRRDWASQLNLDTTNTYILLRIAQTMRTADLLVAAARNYGDPRNGAFGTGFRVASVPLNSFYSPPPAPPSTTPPAAPGSAFVSPALEAGSNFYRDSKSEFLLGVNSIWEKFATPKEFSFTVTPSARYPSQGWGESGELIEEMVIVSVPGASIEFDLDGDGLYETQRLSPLIADPTTSSHSITLKTGRLPEKNGVHRIRARWLAPSGEWIVAESRVYVGMEPGLSIADGAEFTNKLRSQVYLFPPIGSSGAIVSNDGGFRGGRKVFEFDEVKEPGEPIQLSWDLPRADSQRATRVVYVRYVDPAGRAMSGQTFSDDIIFDAVPPRVQEATLSEQPSAAVSRKAARQITLQLKAQDNRSRVVRLQVARGEKRQGRVDTFKYSARRNIPKAGGAVWLRVQDGAGNWSVWTKAKVRPKAKTAR
jgi:hypothetical protein